MSESKPPPDYFSHCTLSDGRRVNVTIPSYAQMMHYWNSHRDVEARGGSVHDPIAEMVDLCTDMDSEEFRSLNILEAAKVMGAMAPLNKAIVEAIQGMETLRQARMH